MPARQLRFAILALACCAAGGVRAQELKVQPTPFSVWLDFEALVKPNAPKIALPIWMESIVSDTTPARDGKPERTNFRVRLRRFGPLNSELQLRLFFLDKAGASPVVTGWTETGSQPFTSPPLGTGLNLSTSESLTIPAGDLDYLDIAVPGDGANIRGAYLSTLKSHQAKHALDFEPAGGVEDPFGNFAPTALPSDDLFLYGRVRATVDPGVVKIVPPDTQRADYEFELDAAPLLAVCTFEVLNADPVEPIYLWANDRAVGPVAVHFPDLADPGYQGARRENEVQFHYAGWLRAQVVIRGSQLSAGRNKIVLGLNEQAGPVAVRAVEIHLKHPWKHSDYESHR